MSILDTIEKKLGHSPHPAIVSLPLGSWTVSAICDVMGVMTGQRSYNDAARISMGIGLIGAAGAVATGLRDYNSIPKERSSHAIATTHASGMAAATTLLAASFLLRKLDERAGYRPSMAARALALGGWGISAYSAWLGGVLVEEHGEAVKPVIHLHQNEAREQLKARELSRSLSSRRDGVRSMPRA